jgi:hypothetical protein
MNDLLYKRWVELMAELDDLQHQAVLVEEEIKMVILLSRQDWVEKTPVEDNNDMPLLQGNVYDLFPNDRPRETPTPADIKQQRDIERFIYVNGE